ncbi:MAG: hypothetical protein ABIL09_26865 [Gemmatimonadota bacterium]
MKTDDDTARSRRRAAVALLGLALSGCAVGSSLGPVRPVEFAAPTQPDRQMRLLLAGIDTLGVLSTTNIAPVQGLDIQRVMGRLTDAAARGLRNLESRTVVTQDEIRWHFRDAAFDSAAVFDRETWRSLREGLGIDALIYLSLTRFQAQMTPVSPGQYGMTSSPGMNFTVDLEIVLINLESGDIWRHQRHASNWQPTETAVIGGGDRSEQQLLAALGGPLRQFLSRIAPPPAPQRRQFDLSGD